MPIAFPLPARGNAFDDIVRRFRKPFDVVPAPNTGRPGVTFTNQSLAPGVPLTKARPNVRRLGTMYTDVKNTSTVNPVNTPLDNIARTFQRVGGRLVATLNGVTRDNTGAALGTCQVSVFTTATKRCAGETVSDASGVWGPIDALVQSPFFVNEYKAGSPDRAGTSLNTIVPTIQLAQ